MKKISLLLGFVFALSLGANAQKTKQVSGKLYALAGVHHYSTPSINKKLKLYSLPELPSIQSYYGSGFELQVNRTVYGIEGYEMTASASKNKVDLSSKGAAGYLYIGYRLFDSKKISITPRIGFGANGFDVIVREESKGKLDEFLVTNSTKELSGGGIIMHTGLKFSANTSDRWTFDLDIGYNRGFEDEPWNTLNGDLSESVSDQFGGAYAQVSMGYQIFNKN